MRNNTTGGEFRLAGMADIILAMGGNIGRIPPPLSCAAMDNPASEKVVWTLLIDIERWPDNNEATGWNPGTDLRADNLIDAAVPAPVPIILSDQTR